MTKVELVVLGLAFIAGLFGYIWRSLGGAPPPPIKVPPDKLTHLGP
jgi:hypothetical protein